MTTFQIHTKDTAADVSRALLEQGEKNLGFVPNLYAGLAESPVALEAYFKLSELVGKTTFTPAERNVAWLEINRYHDCHYCMAAHTGIAKSQGVDDAVIEAARTGAAYGDERLDALKAFVKVMLDERGWAPAEAVDAFLAAGFTKENVFELIVVISHKTISNYANHLLETPVDDAFQKFAWSTADKSDAA